MSIYENLKDFFNHGKPRNFVPTKIQKIDYNLKTMDLRSDPGFPGAIMDIQQSNLHRKFTIPVCKLNKNESELISYSQWDLVMPRSAFTIPYHQNIPERIINRRYSDADPYGEENWDE